VVALCAGLLLVVPALAAPGPVSVYSTAFEYPEFTLDFFPPGGQGGWISDVDGVILAATNYAVQIIADFFPGEGQQALIGFNPPDGTNSVSVRKPLDYRPLAAGKPRVTFTVTMAITNGVSTNLDSFRWSVYNRKNGGERLFSLDFDNLTREVSYLLDQDHPAFVSTGFQFERDGSYDLAITMSFASNQWSATLNDQLVVNALPMTTRGATLDLGDIDAVWVAKENRDFGDNYMVFDNYKVVADSAAPLLCQVEPIQLLSNQGFLLRVVGEPGRTYAVDATSDLATWTPLETNLTAGGSFELLDEGAVGQPRRYYRARAVSP
jgi:hypothetical protein